jgi:thiamine-monophosphate kinase
MSCEFERIAFIRRLKRTAPSGLVRDIGDDCAVFDPAMLHRLVVTTDLLVEGVHFDRAWIGPRLLGRKACVVNLSDLAAMGARPLACQLAMAVPGELPESEFEEMVSGFVDVAEDYGMALVGGDLSSSSILTLSVTAMGSVDSGEPVSRSGARPGDLLYVAGRLGYSRLGLAYLKEHPNSGFERAADRQDLKEILGSEVAFEWVAGHFFPEAMVDAGRFLQETGLATSMIDVSDGLASDVFHLLEESGVAAELSVEAIPLPPGVARDLALECALDGGEDYALAFTIDPARVPELETGWRSEWPVAQRIGTITEGVPQLALRREGRYENLQAKGFDHFK